VVLTIGEITHFPSGNALWHNALVSVNIDWGGAAPTVGDYFFLDTGSEWSIVANDYGKHAHVEKQSEVCIILLVYSAAVMAETMNYASHVAVRFDPLILWVLST